MPRVTTPRPHPLPSPRPPARARAPGSIATSDALSAMSETPSRNGASGGGGRVPTHGSVRSEMSVLKPPSSYNGGAAASRTAGGYGDVHYLTDSEADGNSDVSEDAPPRRTLRIRLRETTLTIRVYAALLMEWPRPAVFTLAVLLINVLTAQMLPVWELQSRSDFAFVANITVIPTVIIQDNTTLTNEYTANVWQSLTAYKDVTFGIGLSVFLFSGVGLILSMLILAFGIIRHRHRRTYLPLKYDGALSLAKWGLFGVFVPVVVCGPLLLGHTEDESFHGNWGDLTSEFSVFLSARVREGAQLLLSTVSALVVLGFLFNEAARKPSGDQEPHPPPPGTWSLGSRCAERWARAAELRAVSPRRHVRWRWKCVARMTYLARPVGVAVCAFVWLMLFFGMVKLNTLDVYIECAFKHLIEAKDGLALIKKRLKFSFSKSSDLKPISLFRVLMRTNGTNYWPGNYFIGLVGMGSVIAAPLARSALIAFLWLAPMHHDSHATVRQVRRVTREHFRMLRCPLPTPTLRGTPSVVGFPPLDVSSLHSQRRTLARHGERGLDTARHIEVRHAPRHAPARSGTLRPLRHAPHGPFVRSECRRLCARSPSRPVLSSSGVAHSRTRNDARRVCDCARCHRAVLGLHVQEWRPVHDA